MTLGNSVTCFLWLWNLVWHNAGKKTDCRCVGKGRWWKLDGEDGRKFCSKRNFIICTLQNQNLKDGMAGKCSTLGTKLVAVYLKVSVLMHRALWSCHIATQLGQGLLPVLRSSLAVIIPQRSDFTCRFIYHRSYVSNWKRNCLSWFIYCKYCVLCCSVVVEDGTERGR
jgi:hypothetical protein